MAGEVTLRQEGGTLYAALHGEIDHHTARSMREAVDGALFRYRPVSLVMDFSDVPFMDSSGIGLILGRVEAADATGSAVRLTGLSPTLWRLLRLSGLERIRNLTVTGVGAEPADARGGRRDGAV